MSERLVALTPKASYDTGLRFLGQTEAKIIRKDEAKLIVAQIGTSFLRSIRIRLEFYQEKTGTRVIAKAEDFGTRVLYLSYLGVLFFIWPVFLLTLALAIDPILFLTGFLIFSAVIITQSYLLPWLSPPSVLPKTLIEDFWHQIEEETLRKIGKPIPPVSTLPFDWLYLTKIGPYVCLYNVIALLTLLLTGVISPVYHYDIEGIGEVTTYTTTAYVAFAAMFLYVVYIPLFYKLHNNIKSAISPKWDELKPFSVKDEDVQSVLNDLCAKLMLKPPSLLVVSKPVNPPLFFYGSSEQEGIVIIYNAVLKSLTRDELEAALAHELYHAKRATSHLFGENVIQKNERLIGFLQGFPYVGLLALLSPVAVGLFNFWLAVMSVIAISPGFGGNLWLSLNFVSTLETDIPTLKQHELYADWFAALTTGRPLSLWRALSATNVLGRIGSIELAKRVQPSISQEHIVNLSNTLKPKILGSETLEERQALLFVIDRSLNSQVMLEIKKYPKSFGGLALLGKSFLTLSMTEFSIKLNKLGEENMKRIFNYAVNCKMSFNLKECARNLALDPELVLYGIFAMVLGRVLKIHCVERSR